MKSFWIVLLGLSAIAPAAFGVDMEAAKKEEQQECIACHGLRFIHTQRLSKAAWQKELDKMAGWGAEMKDKQLLLDYLSTEYSDAKPIPQPAMSSDGSGTKK
jgi:mono/diheme cytochrome c family protein